MFQTGATPCIGWLFDGRYVTACSKFLFFRISEFNLGQQALSFEYQVQILPRGGGPGGHIWRLPSPPTMRRNRIIGAIGLLNLPTIQAMPLRVDAYINLQQDSNIE